MTGQREMRRPIEIEFAGMIDDVSSEAEHKGRIYWLQIRPIINKSEQVDEQLMSMKDEDLLLRSEKALGNGTITDVKHIVYVRPENFNSMYTPEIAREIEKINRDFIKKNEGYVLIGPGRWGSSDTALGIPVKWPNISQARLIVEASLAGYRVEPSQGTHFFQNLTSMGATYFTVDASGGQGYYNVDLLDKMPSVYESERIRVVEFKDPVTIGIDGKKGRGVVVLPMDENEAKE